MFGFKWDSGIRSLKGQIVHKFCPDFILDILVSFYSYLSGENDLDQPELRAYNECMEKLNFAGERKTAVPLMVGLVGLTGSGKTTVGKYLALKIGATVIDQDEIRTKLRKTGGKMEKSRVIAEQVAQDVVRRGGNAVLVGDYSHSAKRASLRNAAKTVGARVIFLRVVCDWDTALGRAITAEYQPDEFFAGATSAWKGPASEVGAVVKVREMTRQIPKHYRWDGRGGVGRWILRSFNFKVFATVDTSDEIIWRKEIAPIADQLKEIK